MLKRMKLAGLALAAVLAAGPALAQGEATVRLLAYTGLFQERYTKAVVEPFMRANPGVKVEYFPLPGSAQMLGTLRAQRAAPQADVVIMDVSVAKTGTDEGLFDPVDESVSRHVADLSPRARFPGVAGVGVTFDNLVLISNVDAVPTAPTSWNVLKDKAYAGKIAMSGAPDIIGIGLTLILDRAAGGQNPLGNVDRGLAALTEIAPNVQTWEPRPEVYPAVVNNQVALGVGWNARSQVFAETSGGRLRVTVPAEGSVFQINTINLVRGGPNAAAAKRFVDYALSPEAQKAFAEAMYYGPTNEKAGITGATLSRTALVALDRVMDVDWIGLARVRDGITEQWRRRIIPLSR